MTEQSQQQEGNVQVIYLVKWGCVVLITHFSSTNQPLLVHCGAFKANDYRQGTWQSSAPLRTRCHGHNVQECCLLFVLTFCCSFVWKLVCCYLGQDSLEKEILNLNGNIPGKIKVKHRYFNTFKYLEEIFKLSFWPIDSPTVSVFLLYMMFQD